MKVEARKPSKTLAQIVSQSKSYTKTDYSSIGRQKKIDLIGQNSRKLRYFLKTNGMRKTRVRKDYKNKIKSSTFDTFDFAHVYFLYF